MNTSKSYECCIIGAGPSGLGCARELVNNDISDILIIDRNKSIGGLSRTDVFEGMRFDVGPHRFFTKNKEINKIWHDTLKTDFRPVSRLTRIYYKNKYFYYPIKPFDVLRKLDLAESLNAILSFFISQTRKNTSVTFEDWIVRRFGRKLYETFFKTYTEKVWGVPCSQIGSEWAAQRIKGLNIIEIIKSSFTGRKNTKIKTLVEQFYYPILGAGQMYEAMCDKIVSNGAEVMLNSNVIRFNRQDNLIKSIDVVKTNNQTINISAKHFFSSIPLTHFFKMLEPADSTIINNAAAMLNYRDHITVNLVVSKQNIFPDQWIYMHSPDVRMARITNYNNFSKAMRGDKNKTALSVEYFVFKNEEIWNKPDKFVSEVAIKELNKIGLVKNTDVENSWVVREPESYPGYYIGFQKPFSILKQRIDQFFNFTSIGRAGLYKYNNQDHSLMSGILATRNYLKFPGTPHKLWDINIDAEYLEDAQKPDEHIC